MYKEISANKRRTVFLFFFFALFLIGVGWAFSYIYNSPGILIFAVVLAVVQSWFSFYFADSVALAVSGAKEATTQQFPELNHLVENIAITAGLPKPKIYVIVDPAPNAFATGRDPSHASVAVTSGLLELLNKRELEGVLAHEMSHIGNYDTRLMTVVVTLVGAVVLLSDIFLRSWFWRGSRDNRDSNNGGNYMVLIGIALAILAPLFAKMIELAISRKREYLADATGSLLTRFPEGLASALEKIEHYERPMKAANRATAHLYINEPFGVDDRKRSWLQTVFSTHPPIHNRIKKLRSML